MEYFCEFKNVLNFLKNVNLGLEITFIIHSKSSYKFLHFDVQFHNRKNIYLFKYAILKYLITLLFVSLQVYFQLIVQKEHLLK